MVALARIPATRLTFTEPLRPVLPPTDKTAVHVVADCGPSEMHCKSCGRFLLFMGEHSTLRGHIGLSAWFCPRCWREVTVTWSAEA